jgi:hypothetical protein
MFNLLLLPCKCSTCLKSPNCKIVQNIQTDSMVFRDNRPFNPTDPLRTADKMRLTVELQLLVMVLPIGDPPTGLQGFTFTLCNCISNIPVFDLTCDLQQTFPPPPLCIIDLSALLSWMMQFVKKIQAAPFCLGLMSYFCS